MPLPIYLISYAIPVTYYIQLLRGIILRGAGLWALWPQALALAGFTEGWAARSGVEVDFHTAGLDRDRLPSAVETALYRVVQEALTNTIKHARASRVCVSISVAGSMLSVVVIDDGVGGATLSPHGSGLVGLSDRAATLDGCLSIASPPGAGTTLELNLPTGVSTS